MKSKNFAIAFVVCLFGNLVSCDQKKETPQWYQNGNLHTAKLSEWTNSTEENKLATCADFAARLKDGTGEKYNNMDEMKYDATKLKACIDEVSKNPENNNQTVAEIAAGCKMIEEAFK